MSACAMLSYHALLSFLQETSSDSGSAVSTLLRSPPSKLRVLPSNCVENNYAHNPKHEAVHKLSQATPCGTARKLRFNPPQPKAMCTSPVSTFVWSHRLR